MEFILEKLKSLWASYKKDIIYIAAILLLLILSCASIRSCCNRNDEIKNLNHSIEAMVDTISTYRTANGELVAQKKILQGNIDLLEIANTDLANDLKAMKVKNAQQALQIKGYIENPPRDTVWELAIDTVYVNSNVLIAKDFNFSDKWRILNGNVTYNPSNYALGLNIKEDKVLFDYTIAIKDGSIYVKSDNPYVTFNELSGITVPKPKRKPFSLGVQVGFGANYGLVNRRFDYGPYVGLGLQYNIF